MPQQSKTKNNKGIYRRTIQMRIRYEILDKNNHHIIDIDLKDRDKAGELVAKWFENTMEIRE
jgi:hypothetical protein